MHTELFHPDLNKFSDKKVPDSQGGTGGLAYGFDGAVGLAKQNGGKNIAESSRNIENILYWSLAMYYDKWLWSTGNPEDPSSLTAAPAKAASVDGEFQVEAAAKKGGKKTTKAVDPPKTEAPPPKTEAPVEPPKTEKPVDPPKTSAAVPPPPPSSQAPPPASTPAAAPPPPASSQAALPASSQAAPPSNSQAPPPASSAAPPASPISTQLPPASTSNSIKPSVTTPISGTASISGSNTASITSLLHTTCSNTLCTLPSTSSTPTSSEAVPQETFESEPMNAGSMTADEIIAIAGSVASEQVAAMALWDQALVEMGLPSETVEGDPTASAGTGLPMATGGMGGVGNGTWNMPVLRARVDREGRRERRMYDYAS